MTAKVPLLPAVSAVVLLSGAGLVGLSESSGYEVKVVLDSATSVVEGAPVQVNGFQAGSVEEIEVRDGKAQLTLSLDDDVAPLHDGAQVVVGWKAVLSERQVEVTDGAESSPEIPDGGMITGRMPTPTEIDDILNSLDRQTRKELQGLLGNLDLVLEDREADLDGTIREGGPALEELGQLLLALGTDGPAIKHLAARLDEMLGVMAARDGEFDDVVSSMSVLVDRVARNREDLRSALTALPPTLNQADRTLGMVPETVDEVEPLLSDLEPATASLTPVARDLAPLLRDLRPFAADLRPALSGLSRLLGVTPQFLETLGSTVPGLTAAASDLKEPVEYLRPYSPEIAGFVSTWNSAFSNYDSNGNFARIFTEVGPTSLNENPGIVPPGVTNDPYPAPGEVVGQPWTDAYGGEME